MVQSKNMEQLCLLHLYWVFVNATYIELKIFRSGDDKMLNKGVGDNFCYDGVYVIFKMLCMIST